MDKTVHLLYTAVGIEVSLHPGANASYSNRLTIVYKLPEASFVVVGVIL